MNSKKNYSNLFYLVRKLVRFFIPKYKIEQLPEIEASEPIVFISHHQNMIGPIGAMAWLSKELVLRVWALNVFFDKDKCFDHYSNFTFKERFGWPQWFANLVAWPVSRVVVRVLEGAQAIPVFRQSRKIIKTFQLSIEKLKKGDHILIFPDVDYTSDDQEVGEIYEGFLHIEKYYYRQTGEHVSFIPMLVDQQNKIIRFGDRIKFNTEPPFIEQRSEIAEKIQRALNELAGN